MCIRKGSKIIINLITTFAIFDYHFKLLKISKWKEPTAPENLFQRYQSINVWYSFYFTDNERKAEKCCQVQERKGECWVSGAGQTSASTNSNYSSARQGIYHQTIYILPQTKTSVPSRLEVVFLLFFIPECNSSFLLFPGDCPTNSTCTCMHVSSEANNQDFLTPKHHH